MSERTRSAGVLPSNPSASRPLAASPTTTRGSADAQSSRSSRNLRRAGASSSTMRSLSGTSDMLALRYHGRPIRHADVHFVTLPGQFALEARLSIKMQCQPLADVVHRHLVASVMVSCNLVRIAQDRMYLAPAQEDVNRDHPRRARRFDAVIDSILEQRLQHQGRDHRIARHVLGMPLDDETLPETQLFQIEILTAQLDFVGERGKLAVVAHQHPEEVREIFQSGFGATRLATHE